MLKAILHAPTALIGWLSSLYWTWLAVRDVRRGLCPTRPNNPRYANAYTRVYCKFNHVIDLSDYFDRNRK